MTPTTQPMLALQQGNTIRLNIARYKLELRSLTLPEACRMLADHLNDPDLMAGWHGRMRAGQTLRSIRMVGENHAAVMLRRSGVMSMDRRFGEMTARQRSILADELRYRADQYRQR